MAPKRPAAAAASPEPASDASDGEAGAARDGHRRRTPASPSRSRSRSRSRSKSPRPNLGPSAAASDSDADARAPSPRRTDRARSPREHLDSDADADADAGRRAPSPRRRGERSPSIHSDSDADAAGRSPSPRRSRERTPTPLVHYDSGSDNTAAAAASDDDGAGAGSDPGDASPLPSARRSSRVETSSVKPVSTRPMDLPLRESSQRRAKRRRSPSPEYPKRPPRVWSPEDEVTILSALIEFRAKKGRLPASIQDTGKVHGQIIHQLTANASTAQLSDKVRRLKHKYKLLLTRAKNGKDPNLPTQHDRDVYELSKKVWGLKSLVVVRGSRVPAPQEDAEDAEESNEEQEEIEESDEDMENGWELRDRTSKKPKALTYGNGNANAIVAVDRAGHGDGSGRDDAEKGKQMYPYLWEAVEELAKEHPSGPIFRKAFGVLEKSKARVVEEKLRKFRTSEIRQQLQRMDLMKETVGMVLDALEGAY